MKKKKRKKTILTKNLIVTAFILTLSLTGIMLINSKISAMDNHPHTNKSKAEGVSAADKQQNPSVNSDENSSELDSYINSEEVSKEGYEADNKLSEGSQHNKSTASEAETLLKEMENNIKNYMGADLNSLGFIYYDTSTGEKISINENKIFLAASTVKVQLNMIAYDWAEKGRLSLDDSIKYKESDNEDGTGILQNQDKSQPFKIQELLDYSIIYSDNIATNMLFRTLGGYKKVRSMVNKKFGINMDTSGNYITPQGEFTILKYLYDNRTNSNYAHLIDVMKGTVFHDRIDKYIPQDISAHKTGEYDYYVNDVGIIFTENPYILVVYTYNIENAHEKIAEISKMIYNYHINK
ncbi:serine hydrolase [Clostridium polynesiense]|uniref:serine hydrolase n=1 Tax=Clostridium polynesiense TaxID=1325933 RepID=UPI0006932932|nr:serine hydrolase [Clostridium polynesiense]